MTQAPAPDKPSDLPQRVGVGIILIVVAVLALQLGDWAFWLLAVVAGLLMMAEWGPLVGASARESRLAQFALSVPLAILSPWAAGPDFFALGLIAGMAFFIVIVTRKPALGLGLAYVGVPVFALVWLRAQPDGLLLTLWALALVWATDIGAFFTGRGIGGPKLAPRISPNKTWAGLAGGIVTALVLGLALHASNGLALPLAIASAPLAALSQAGDLYESWLKRRAGVKDSGNLLPGHGGVLDRLDGVVAAAPFAALAVVAGRAL